MSDRTPGEYPLTESGKAELRRRAQEAAAEQDKMRYPQVRSGGIYDVLARAGSRLADPDPARAAGAERDLLKTWAPADLKVALAIASGRLTRQAWDEMGDERWKLFRPRGFSAWERGRTS
jgi:DNA-binding PadR family transcriptional regulator